MRKDPLYVGPTNEKSIYISYTKSHYNVIKSMKVFLNRSYFCDFCKKGYDSVTEHKCNAICKMCFRRDCYDDRITFQEFFLHDSNEYHSEEKHLNCKFCKINCNNNMCNNLHEEKYCFIPKLCSKMQSIKETLSCL